MPNRVAAVMASWRERPRRRSLSVYGLLDGGRWRLLGPGFFAVAALGESHHVLKTILHADYFPGP